MRLAKSRALRRALLPLGFSLVAIVGAPRSAHANDVAASEALFNEGQRLFAAGQIHQACEKFGEAYNQDNTAIGALINLARCHEKEGKTASAWGEYKQVEIYAARSNQKEREQFAHDEAGKLEPTLHKLSLNVKFPVDGIEVTRNGIPIGKGQWGTEVPVDPGDVILKATAPGKKDWSQTVHLAAGPGIDHFEIPKLDDAPVAPPSGDKDSTIVANSGPSTGKYVGLALAGGGVIAAGIGVVFQLIALQQDSKSKDATLSNQSTAEISKNQPLDTTKQNPCTAKPPDKTLCPSSYNKFTEHDAAVTDQTVAIPLIAGGAALAIAGAVVYFTSGDKYTVKKTEKGAFDIKLLPNIGPQQNGLTLVGTF